MGSSDRAITFEARSLLDYRKSKKVRRISLTIATYIALVIGSVVFVLPFFWMLSSSFKPVDEIFTIPIQLLPQHVTVKNYVDAFRSLPFNLFYFNTAKISVLSILGTFISCSLAGYGFARLNFVGKNVIFIILLGSMMLPFQVTIIPLFITFKHLGWLNTHWPLIVPNFFGQAFFVFLMRQYFMTIPKELEEAAIVEGAGHLRIFSQIILPLAKPALVTVAIFTFQNSWNDFFNPLIYINAQEKMTVALGLSLFKDEMQENWHLMMSGATTASIPPILVFFLFQRYFVEGIAITGIKS